MPCAVLRAESAEQVQVALRWATEHRVPVVPRGAGTSLSGGATAVDGCLVLTLERMTGIRVDPDRRVAHVEPGALNVSVKEAAAVHGLWYPPDPGSYRISTIGGNIATNAGGLCCVKYGVTADYVLGLEVVLADGRLLRLGGETMKDVAGLNLRQLFVGSEGTLGHRDQRRAAPGPPAGRGLHAGGHLPRPRLRGHRGTRIGRSVRPAMLELMDRVSINAVEDHSPRGLDRDAGALLIVQSDAPGRARIDEIAAVEALCEDAGATEVATTDDADEGLMFVDARRSAGDATEARGTLLAEDICVPVDRLPEVLAEITALAARHDLEIPVVAHAGDGNLHPGIIYPPGDDDARDRAWLAFDELMALATAYGGTVTGEHGVGRTKTRGLVAQVGPDVMAVSRSIKAALDPLGLLNPGALLPLDGGSRRVSRPAPPAAHAVTYRAGGGLDVVPAPPASHATPPGPGEVAVRVRYAGICGTDLHIARGHFDGRVAPGAVLGHEASGAVAAVGEGVEAHAVGDPVVVHPVVACGTCPSCDRGRPQTCAALVVAGLDRPGSMQPTWTVPASCVLPLPRDLDLRSAALVEPLAVAVHDVRRGDVRAGDRVLVVGAGPVGVLIGLVCRAAGAVVSITDPDARRSAAARAAGLDVAEHLLDLD